MLPVFLKLWILGFVIILFLMTFLWLLSIKKRNAGMVYLGWAVSFVILTSFYCAQTDGFYLRNILIFLMVALWGLRLAFHLVQRIERDPKEDSRYQKLRRFWKSKENYKFFFFFQSQTIVIMILSTPFLVIACNSYPYIQLIELIAFILWIIAFMGETTSDSQLRRFKSYPQNKGKVCQTGFWNYSRHPNYFFEWLIWISFFLFALGSPYGWLTLYCPVIIFYSLVFVSGIPPAEAQALKSKGVAYWEYQRTTSMFFPWFKRKD